MTPRQTLALFLPALAVPLVCMVAGAIAGGDPMVALEVVGGTLGILWVIYFLRELHRTWIAQNALLVDARAVTLFAVPCQVTPALGADAVVAGLLRPRIFIGEPLLLMLLDDELQAVVFHEDHHRRTLAPLRAAALEAWLVLLGRSSRARGIILGRLTDLETLADADAIRRGSHARSLARALLKSNPSLVPASLAYSVETRIERLASPLGDGRFTAGRLPYEWLPAAMLVGVVVACHLAM